MWLHTQHGFVSIVAYDPKKDVSGMGTRLGVRSKTSHLLFRARVKADLEDIRDHYIPGLEIDTDGRADYAYRAIVSREDAKSWLCVAIDELDYFSHFKEVASDRSAKTTPARHSVLMGVWSEFARLQDIRPWSGYTTGLGSGYSKTTTYTPPKECRTCKSSSNGCGTVTTVKGMITTSKWVCRAEPSLGTKLDPTTGDPVPVTSPPEPGVEVDDLAEPVYDLDINWLKDQLTRRATDDFENSETQRLTEPAFELFCHIDEKYKDADQQPLTLQQIEDEIDDLINSADAIMTQETVDNDGPSGPDDMLAAVEEEIAREVDEAVANPNS